eukprot:CAMPEP_0113454514 /NCGR_PEP_ID=MMETSP0014_2-20120614/7900_1 /TAXON_ID=2857 /ORGANISM="Nitzschia sp." /LENGTH=235 /DNA_ID=CAMNT_0000345917 /DNA_START=269 /DNA_END=976 /DNA_ORIENTATION=+ /assembly_acc=CAM_ASM_000159
MFFNFTKSNKVQPEGGSDSNNSNSNNSNSNRNNNNNKKMKRQQSVSFDLSQNKTRQIVHCNDLSNEERNVIWYRQEEYAEIKQSFVVVVRKMMRSPNQQIEETDEICCRGLEARTKVGSRARSRVRCKAIWSVLDEQSIQLDEGVHDEDFIADVYSELTSSSSLEALNKGLKDQSNMLDLLDPIVRADRDQKMKERCLSVQSKDVPLIKPSRRASNVAESLINSTDLQSLTMLVV